MCLSLPTNVVIFSLVGIWVKEYMLLASFYPQRVQ